MTYIQKLRYAAKQAHGSIGGGGELAVFLGELAKLAKTEKHRRAIDRVYDEMLAEVKEESRSYYSSKKESLHDN